MTEGLTLMAGQKEMRDHYPMCVWTHLDYSTWWKRDRTNLQANTTSKLQEKLLCYTNFDHSCGDVAVVLCHAATLCTGWLRYLLLSLMTLRATQIQPKLSAGGRVALWIVGDHWPECDWFRSLKVGNARSVRFDLSSGLHNLFILSVVNVVLPVGLVSMQVHISKWKKLYAELQPPKTNNPSD